jgi:hypothetical protein
MKVEKPSQKRLDSLIGGGAWVRHYGRRGWWPLLAMVGQRSGVAASTGRRVALSTVVRRREAPSSWLPLFVFENLFGSYHVHISQGLN